MTRFRLRPEVFTFDSIDDFVSHFRPSKQDTVFTERLLYEKYMKNKLSCNFIFQDDYGLGEPSDIVIDKILESIYGKRIDRFIGIGGGAVLDITKLLCIKDATSVEDIFEERIPLVRDKGLILVPTTCGTGAEMTCVSVVDIASQKTKIGKRIEANFADAAVLIPELLNGIPANVFLFSSVDALIHAMEIFVAPTGNPFNDVFCEAAIRTIVTRYKDLVENGLSVRFKYLEEFLRASAFAGVALSNTVCGAVHALAMHFGSVHHVPHGESNARFLTAVFNKYAEIAPTGKLKQLAEIVKDALAVDTDIAGAFFALEELINKMIPKKRLREYGVKEEDVPIYVDKVIATQQRLLKNNFVSLSREDLIDIYEAVL